MLLRSAFATACIFSLSSCNKSSPTAPVTVSIIKVASPTSGTLTTSNSNSSATSLYSITLTPTLVKYPVRRIELLPEPEGGKGIIFDGNETLNVTPSGTQETLLVPTTGNVATGTYTGLRVVYMGTSDTTYTTTVKASFQLFSGTNYATGASGLVTGSSSASEQTITATGSSRTEITFVNPITLSEGQSTSLYVYLDPTQIVRAGYGGTNGSRYWGKDCSGTYDDTSSTVTSGPFICAGLPRFFVTTEEVTPTIERYITYSILHVCNSDGSNDPVEDTNNGTSAVYSLFFHPTSGGFLGGVATRMAVEGSTGGGEPSEAGYGVISLADNGNGTYTLGCDKTCGGSSSSACCTYSTFRRSTHSSTYTNRNSECWGYGATKQ